MSRRICVALSMFSLSCTIVRPLPQPEPEPVAGEEASCVPDCDGRRCGDDGCGGTCGECNGDRVCTDQGTCEVDCPAHSDWDGEFCVCDAGYIPDSDCATCTRDDGDGCPENSYASGSSCVCVAGYLPNASGCGCEPSGFIASPCLSDGECNPDLFLHWSFCAYDLADFNAGHRSTLSGPLPEGYCSTIDCAYCAEYGGTCVEMGSDLNGDKALACLAACNSDDQCRAGYECRRFTTDEHWDADLGSYCLPEG